MSELRDRIRAQQAGVESLTHEQIVEALWVQLTIHEDHPWHQMGRCVYCGPCGERLYQGTIPEGHPIFKPKPKRTASDAAQPEPDTGGAG